jgi:hypothetical protein
VSPRRQLCLFALGVAVLVASALRCEAQTTRDTTVCTAYRTRTAASGEIVSTSVTKVPCGRVHRTAPRDDPNGYDCWLRRDQMKPTCVPEKDAVRESDEAVLRAYGMSPGYTIWMWRGVVTRTDPSRLPVQPSHDWRL